MAPQAASAQQKQGVGQTCGNDIDTAVNQCNHCQTGHPEPFERAKLHSHGPSPFMLNQVREGKEETSQTDKQGVDKDPISHWQAICHVYATFTSALAQRVLTFRCHIGFPFGCR